MKKVKIIFSDIDGTFLSRDRRGFERNCEAIRKFTSNGGLFTFASGRLRLDELFSGWKELVNAPLVLCNGALVCDNDGSVLWEEPIDPGLANELHAACLSTPYDSTYSEIYTLDGQTCYKVTVTSTAENMNGIHARIWEEFGDRCSYTYSCEQLLELMNHGTSKASALSRMREYYRDMGIELEVYAVGDYINDLEMLAAADFAACPGNACDEVKERAQIQLCDASEGAIADLIEKIMDDQIMETMPQ